MNNLDFNYVDIIIVALLIVGIFRGRKRGMSEELLTFLQWIIIVFGGAVVYGPGGKLLASFAPFSLLTCNITVYVLFAVFIKLFFSQIQKAVGEKLVGSNFFGNSEYYLGMMAGMIRFACVMLSIMAVLNARLITDRERAATARMQSKNFEGISFPTFGSIQQSVLFQSFTGRQVKEHLSFALIESTTAENVALRRAGAAPYNKVLDQKVK
jgi:uncharacterized membrane protein required for colicin V production